MAANPVARIAIKTIEHINLREAQIALERARRDYDRFRDDVAVDVRAAAREIDRALFSLDIQEENVVIAQQRVASIEADPDRATVRDKSEANTGLLNAQNSRDAAERDLQVAILQYLLATGQLRVADSGRIRPLRGMEYSDADADDLTPGSSALPSPPGESGS